jgi:decaprenyl-phosphate phosphoribosyltransferase
MNHLRALFRAMRQRQWVKNVLVVAGPLAAGKLTESGSLRAVLVAFVTFCLASAGVYLINDVIDRDADRLHPTKKSRPIASGEVGIPVAVSVGVALLLAAPLLAVLLGYGKLAFVLLAYTLLQLSYCFWLKHQAVIDLAVVSSGFLLRAIAGGVAAGVPLSMWFLLVAAFGSLFMVAGKRYSEVRLVGDGESATRRSLEEYSASYLRFVWSMSGSATIVFYSLWAFSLDRTNEFLPQLSIVPFVLGLLRYAVDIDRGDAGEPESIVLGDRALQAIGVLWLLAFTTSVVVG